MLQKRYYKWNASNGIRSLERFHERFYWHQIWQGCVYDAFAAQQQIYERRYFRTLTPSVHDLHTQDNDCTDSVHCDFCVFDELLFTSYICLIELQFCATSKKRLAIYVYIMFQWDDAGSMCALHLRALGECRSRWRKAVYSLKCTLHQMHSACDTKFWAKK